MITAMRMIMNYSYELQSWITELNCNYITDLNYRITVMNYRMINELQQWEWLQHQIENYKPVGYISISYKSTVVTS